MCKIKAGHVTDPKGRQMFPFLITNPWKKFEENSTGQSWDMSRWGNLQTGV